ncbi:RNA-directed DNA polymerase, eukaryota [Tanacetum coccineum]
MWQYYIAFIPGELHCHELRETSMRIIPPRRASVARRALVARRVPSARTANNPARNASTTTDAPMIVATIKKLIETRVAQALANQEQLRNSGVNGDGVFGLTQWFEKMESVFHISNCTVENQVKLATCTLLGATLTWWNSYVKTVGYDAAYGMPWKTLMKMMTFKYCPRSKIKKLEIEIWNLKESDEVEKYVGVLPDMIQAENKRKFDNNNQAQQQLLKRQNVAQAYAAGTGKRKEYPRTLPLCNKCKFHHNGPCTVKCANCKKVSHLTRDCWNPTTANNQRTITCYECGNQGHYRSDCPKLRNRNQGNQAKDTKAHGVVYALGGVETDQDPNNIEDEIEAQEEDFLASTSEP